MIVLIDANVILDYIGSREPFYQDAYEIINMCHKQKIKGYIAFHSVSIIWYTLRKFIPANSERRLWLKKILQIIQVISASHEDVLKAIDMNNFKDFEDCLQFKCAETVNARFIITNNIKDFSESMIPAVTPAEFCRRIKE
ncbi:MAG: PIN domain-containing protein [Lachnospiraceae bacterium]